MGYFNWLCDLVCSDSTGLWLLSELDSHQYVWHLILDENREKGGLALRQRYAREIGVMADDVRRGPCTMLEMLIALSELMSEQMEGFEPYECFWMIIDNWKLEHFACDKVGLSIERYLSGNYSNTNGGPFPLYHYYGDIRGLDLYSQMNAWLEENYPHQNIF